MVDLGNSLIIQPAAYPAVKVYSLRKEIVTLFPPNMMVRTAMADDEKIVLARKMNVQVA